MLTSIGCKANQSELWLQCSWDQTPSTNKYSPWDIAVGRWLSFWGWPFSGAFAFDLSGKNHQTVAAKLCVRLMPCFAGLYFILGRPNGAKRHKRRGSSLWQEMCVKLDKPLRRTRPLLSCWHVEILWKMFRTKTSSKVFAKCSENPTSHLPQFCCHCFSSTGNKNTMGKNHRIAW